MSGLSSLIGSVGDLGLAPIEGITDIFDHIEDYVVPTRTVPIVIGEPTSMMMCLEYHPTGEGKPRMTQGNVTFTGGVFTRLSRRTNMSRARDDRESSEYSIASMVFNDLSASMGVSIDGTNYPLEAFLWSLWQQSLPADQRFAGTDDEAEQSIDGFVDLLAALGLRIRQPQSMLVQHMNANDEAINSAWDFMLANGASDTTGKLANPGTITRQVELPRENGLQLVRFEMGRADRDMSETHQGYLDPVNAQIENFTRIIRLLKEAQGLQAAMDNAVAEGQRGWNDAKVKETNGQIQSLQAQARQWNNTWGGAQQSARMVNGSIVLAPEWYGVNVPVGRFSVQVPGQPGETHTFDFWKERATSTQASQATSNALLDLVGGKADSGPKSTEKPSEDEDDQL